MTKIRFLLIVLLVLSTRVFGQENTTNTTPGGRDTSSTVSLVPITNNTPRSTTENLTSANDTFYPEYYYEEDLERLLIDHATWVTSAPGVIFNSFTILVVCRMKPFTTNSLFILVLGLTDLLNVVMRICSALTYFIETVSNVTCKLFDFLIITTFNYSNMILVCWTVERLIAVWYPTKYAVYCTFKNTLIALIVTGVALSLLSIPYLVGAYASQTEHGFVECQYSEFLYGTWTPIETTYYIWVPMIIVCVSNALIIHRLIHKKSENLSQGMTTERAEQRARDQRQMTNVLLSVSLAFLILHIPQICVTLYLSIKSGSIEIFVSDPFGPLKSLLWCFIVTEFQNSINFFLYFLTGREFRSHVLKMLCGCRRKGDATRSSKTASTQLNN